MGSRKKRIKRIKRKDLYRVTYTIEEEIKKTEEKKDDILPETIERKFFIFMVPTVYIFREEQPNPNKKEEVEECHIKNRRYPPNA